MRKHLLFSLFLIIYYLCFFNTKNSMKIADKEFEPFISEAEILQHVKSVAQAINNDFADKKPIFIGIMNGAFMFLSDLMKEITIPCEVSCMKLSSYAGTESSGVVSIQNDLSTDIKGRTVVIVEDIVESGLSMCTLMERLKKEQPAEIHIATMFLKPNMLKIKDLKIDYIGMKIPDEFIVGYGLDYNEYGRNNRDLYKIKAV